MADEVKPEAVPVEAEGKVWWQSKTILVNAILGVLMAIIPVVPAAKPIADWMGSHLEVIGVGWSMLGMLLRAVTSDKIILKP